MLSSLDSRHLQSIMFLRALGELDTTCPAVSERVGRWVAAMPTLAPIPNPRPPGSSRLTAVTSCRINKARTLCPNDCRCLSS
ncbi:Uncharacterized protein DAT39_012589 [Clarias magur]|uniref:Uncharacterized protein n=1 Tax=Clarias magur TaxID=1594786 RepID=A0A8J4X8X8_CLAMG|nr:Uncharacterized protein DAT39_012589 [Clarias magur]